MDWNGDVKSYLRFCEDPDFTVPRPSVCPHCGHGVLHRHGQYRRDADALDGIYRMPVFRFLCALPTCRRTTSVLPSFVGRHQRATWDLQEFAVSACDDGKTLEQVTGELSNLGCIDSMWTILRWKQTWLQILLENEGALWALALSVFPSLCMPVGTERPRSRLRWLSHVWEQIAPWRMSMGMFHGLHRLRQQLPILSG